MLGFCSSFIQIFHSTRLVWRCRGLLRILGGDGVLWSEGLNGRMPPTPIQGQLGLRGLWGIPVGRPLLSCPGRPVFSDWPSLGTPPQHEARGEAITLPPCQHLGSISERRGMEELGGQGAIGKLIHQEQALWDGSVLFPGFIVSRNIGKAQEAGFWTGPISKGEYSRPLENTQLSVCLGTPSLRPCPSQGYIPSLHGMFFCLSEVFSYLSVPGKEPRNPLGWHCPCAWCVKVWHVCSGTVVHVV